MPGDPGGPVVNTRVLSTNAHEAAGAAGTRHSPRPLFSWARDSSTTRAHRAARSQCCVCCLTFESSCVVPAKAGTHSHRRLLGQKASASAPKMIGHGVWIPARASLGRDDERVECAHSRDPLARNDGTRALSLPYSQLFCPAEGKQ